MTTFLFANPAPGSFDHSILSACTDALTQLGRDYQVIDLYADGFNPVLTHGEISSGSVTDELVERYISMLQRTDRLVIIFPIWWGTMPAILKGFFDRVFVCGRIYDFDTATGAMLPNLSIASSMIVTTSGGAAAPTASFISDTMVNDILTPVGITGTVWHDCANVATISPAAREAFIDTIVKSIAS
ncbi:MAG: NAD(P)H-dependent oxidoreductase [Paramuribaculum sp.]|nr:NAD(P)H-dependent oxidoreductase [Paramuribaculum sp.]